MASAVLEAIGEPAFGALQAATRSADAEVGRRARVLAQALQGRVEEKQVRAIQQSRLSAEEKGRRLMKFIPPGASEERVWQVLGFPDGLWSRRGFDLLVYQRYHLVVLTREGAAPEVSLFAPASR
jgi:hypothetical protein